MPQLACVLVASIAAGCVADATDPASDPCAWQADPSELEAVSAMIVDHGRAGRFDEARAIAAQAASTRPPTSYEAGRLLEALGHAEALGARAAERRADAVVAAQARQRAMSALSESIAVQDAVIASALGAAEGVDR